MKTHRTETYKDSVLVGIDERPYTQDEIDAEISSNRKYHYGPIEDQLDMIYWDQVNGTRTFKDHIAAIKSKYPK